MDNPNLFLVRPIKLPRQSKAERIREDIGYLEAEVEAVRGEAFDEWLDDAVVSACAGMIRHLMGELAEAEAALVEAEHAEAAEEMAEAA